MQEKLKTDQSRIFNSLATYALEDLLFVVEESVLSAGVRNNRLGR